MQKKKKKKHLIPSYAAPIARSVALKISAVRQRRKLDIETLAAKLGISPAHYVLLEQAEIIPSPVLATRLLDWLLNPRYQCESPCSDKNYGLRKTHGWRKTTVQMPSADYKVFRAAATMSGMSLAQFAFFAMRQVASNRLILSTMAQAAEEYRWARTTQALEDVPELKHIIELDMKKVDKGKPIVLQRPPLHKLLDLTPKEIDEVGEDDE